MKNTLTLLRLHANSVDHAVNAIRAIIESHGDIPTIEEKENATFILTDKVMYRIAESKNDVLSKDWKYDTEPTELINVSFVVL